MRWTRQRRARRYRRAGLPVSDRRARKTNGADPPSLKLRRDWYQARRPAFSKGGRVRQKRVVLAPVAGVKSAKVFRKPDRARKTINSPATVARRIRRRGER